MSPRTDRLLLLDALLGQFITGFAGRSVVVALPTIVAPARFEPVFQPWRVEASKT
jgi:hypothetical protein